MNLAEVYDEKWCCSLGVILGTDIRRRKIFVDFNDSVIVTTLFWLSLVGIG